MGLDKAVHLKDDWISSRVLPFVSGTHKLTNTTVNALMTMYIVNVPINMGN